MIPSYLGNEILAKRDCNVHQDAEELKRNIVFEQSVMVIEIILLIRKESDQW